MRIAAIFFDMGGTIETFWYDRDLRLKATPQLARRLAQAGIELTLTNRGLYEVVSAGLARYHAWSLKSWQELPTTQIWREYILPGYAIDTEKLDAVSEELMCWIETHYYRRQMRPEMPEVLEQIQRLGLKIGLISNSGSRTQVPDNLEQYGLRRYFDPIVLSSEYGRRKPDPAIFHTAARLAGVPTRLCAYVGDRITRDIEGARRAGFGLAIQVRHGFDHGEPDLGRTPDAVIGNMHELVDILATAGVEPREAPPALLTDPSRHTMRGVLFDAGDILYYRKDPGRRLFEYLARIKIDPAKASPEEKERLRQLAYTGAIDLDQYHRSLLRLYEVTSPEDTQDGLLVLNEAQNDIAPIDGVNETLRALKARGLLLGVVTDTAVPLHTKLNWFERCGFGDLWDTVIASTDLGVCKPDPRAYQAALIQLGLQPEEAVFVGHCSKELAGAKAVGLTTIAFNYEATAVADIYIEHFRELAGLSLLTVEGEPIRPS